MHIKNIQKELIKVIKWGYGDTVKIIINGEYYDLVYPESMV